MPKKTIPVRAQDLRRDDVIKLRDYRIPLMSNGRSIFAEAATHTSLDRTVDVDEHGFLVERVVDERLTVQFIATEREPIDQVIAECVRQYEHKNGDPQRMKIVTSKSLYDGSGIEVRLEGWIR